MQMSEMFFTKLGWWLFVVSAIFFIWAAWRAGDMIATIGAVAFLAANISFMIPVYRRRKK